MTSKSNHIDHIPASVIWYSSEKRYGFVRCLNDSHVSAFLHQKELNCIGVSSVKPGQSLQVKLRYSSENKAPAAYDVIVSSKHDKSHNYKQYTSTSSSRGVISSHDSTNPNRNGRRGRFEQLQKRTSCRR